MTFNEHQTRIKQTNDKELTYKSQANATDRPSVARRDSQFWGNECRKTATTRKMHELSVLNGIYGDFSFVTSPVAVSEFAAT